VTCRACGLDECDDTLTYDEADRLDYYGPRNAGEAEADEAEQ
jgi:uncharacterized ferredoxin-like protein